MRVRSLCVLLAGAVFVLAGCVDVEQIEQEQARAAAPPPKVFSYEEYADDELPGTERTLGPLDDEHLIVPIPDGWFVPARSSKWLMRSQFVRDNPYPSIIVTGGASAATDAGGDVIKQLGASNWRQYAKQLEAKLAEEHQARVGEEADEAESPEVSGVKVGRLHALMYVKPASAGGKSLQRLMLVVIERGREYQVELRALRGTLRRFRPEAYAVAARLKVF